ncbi:hypothetical protein K504DRAFT_347912, partial [Pleomassaria siparia CBS 279.74]
MGRVEKSQGLAPPSIRKDQRAKLARQIVHKTIPAILASNARARKGSEGSELIVDPGPVGEDADVGGDKKKEKVEDDVVYVKRKGQGRRKVKGGNGDADHEKESKMKGNGNIDRSGFLENDIAGLRASSHLRRRHEPHIRIVTTDTLTAANMLAFPHKHATTSTPISTAPKTTASMKKQNPCILNMASPLRPGGGVLTGATSQEEFLCVRTTLLPSLLDSYYRLPELGGVFTRDVLVFRGPGSLSSAAEELAPLERWWIDVISAGMLRFPELEGGVEGDDGKIRGGRLGRRDRDIAEEKIRAVCRIAKAKRVKKLVLGAWGCGAYGNPVLDIAKAWRKVLAGDVNAAQKKGKGLTPLEQWDFDEIVFAIMNEKMAKEFAGEFGGDVVVERGPGRVESDREEDSGEDEIAEELRTKIEEINGQIEQVWNPELKKRLGIILEGLKKQLKEREGVD